MIHASKLVHAAIGDIAYAAIARDPGGYNLMPYRGRRARAVRRTRAFGMTCAALSGIGAATVLASVDARDEAQLAMRRHALEVRFAENAERVAEHARLSAVLEQHERESAQARQRAASRDEFLALLDRLAGTTVADVALTELHRRDGETVLSGRVSDQRRLSAWLGELQRSRGVVSAQVVSLRRPRTGAGARHRIDVDAPAAHARDEGDFEDARGMRSESDAVSAGSSADGCAEVHDRGLEFVARLIYARPGNQVRTPAAGSAARRVVASSTVATGISEEGLS